MPKSQGALPVDHTVKSQNVPNNLEMLQIIPAVPFATLNVSLRVKITIKTLESSIKTPKNWLDKNEILKTRHATMT